MLFTGRQTRWDVLTLGRFDFRHFDFGTFWPVCSQKCSLCRVWLNIVKIYLGRFDSPKMGRFGKSLGMFWLWDVLTWDILTLGHFDQCVHKKCLLCRVWLNIVKIYLGRFDSPKMGRFGKSLGTFWCWDVLTGYQWYLRLCPTLPSRRFRLPPSKYFLQTVLGLCYSFLSWFTYVYRRWQTVLDVLNFAVVQSVKRPASDRDWRFSHVTLAFVWRFHRYSGGTLSVSILSLLLGRRTARVT